MTTGTAVATGVYTIDPARSRIRFSAAHAFGLGPVTGTFTVRDGTVTVTDGGAAVSARVAADSFTTDKPRRDADVRSKRFLHAQAHPDLTFVGDRLVHDGARWSLQGQLTVRGIAAPVILELDSVEVGPDGCHFRARTRVDRYAHKVGPRGIVARHLTADLDITAVPSR